MSALLFLFLLLFLPVSHALEPPTENIKFFETNIRPLLVERCFTCHSDKMQMNNLRLDSLDALLKGGQRGGALVPGKPEESLIYQAVTYENPELKMPPGRPLSEEQTALLKRWIEMEAPWPDSTVPIAEATKTLEREFTEDEKNHWAFQPIRVVDPPLPEDNGWSRNEIDKFIFSKLHAEGLDPTQEADKRALIRRVYYDLIGLPPTEKEISDFIANASSTAYEDLVDTLLASPKYGEKWARHWLDLVRYAESDGYKADQYRPEAWRYRDYVIQSFNEDKPYNQFVMEQLAGDEIAPNNLEAITATGFLRLGIYEYNQRDARTQWKAILDELTDVTGDVFLGLGVSCARCHDHKFDPILQKDYYRLQAFFTPIQFRNDVPLVTAQEWSDYQQKKEIWEYKTQAIQNEIDAIEKPHYDKAAKAILETFPEDIKEMIYKSPGERAPFEQQMVNLAEFQAVNKGEEAVNGIKGDERERLNRLYQERKKFESLKPKPLPFYPIATDVGPAAPPTFIPKDKNKIPIEPGFLSILDPKPAEIEHVPSAPNSTGRRTALARWIARPDNPLSLRVIVNRVWQYHFGQGIVQTPSEFGKLGQPPSHPELLDWLANRFVKDGWSFKKLHKLILTSAAYRQNSRRETPEIALKQDPGNQWLWRMNARRLQAEEIRDSLLLASGELDVTGGGPSVDSAKPRRTLYTKVFRNQTDPLLGVFDFPDGLSSTATRNNTTTPLQSLFMLNANWLYQRAQTVASSLLSAYDRDSELVKTAFLQIYGRPPSPDEIINSLAFLNEHVNVIAQAKQQQEDRLIGMIKTYFASESNAEQRTELLASLQQELEELKDRIETPPAITKRIQQVGGEGGPHKKASNPENSAAIDATRSSSADTQHASAFVDLCHVLLNSNEFLYVE